MRDTVKAYDRSVEKYFEKTRNGRLDEQMKRFADLLPENGEVLDLACGPGRDAKLFCDMGFQVLGIDGSPNMVAKAREIAPLAEFEVLDFKDVDFRERFDGIWFNAGLLCVPKVEARDVLERVHRALKKGGVLHLSVKEGDGEGWRLDARYQIEKYYAYYQRDEILGMLSGFEVLEAKIAPKKDEYQTHPWIMMLCRKAPIEL